jgi:deoxyribodipyrimidine photo-lyase
VIDRQRRERWQPARVHGNGGQRGWFGMGDGAEAFLDELITWRELGPNYTWQRDDYEDFGSLPAWAQATLAAHTDDPREHCYSLADFAAARTHDPVWNAAMTQLRESGVLQSYLRMLWGKKVLEWTCSPQQAFAFLIELNNRYALDGRDPNSYSGISWVFGRYDRPWAPVRPVFGSVRFMSTANTVRKLALRRYLEQWRR